MHFESPVTINYFLWFVNNNIFRFNQYSNHQDITRTHMYIRLISNKISINTIKNTPAAAPPA